MHRWEVRDQREQGLQYAQLDIDALVHAVRHGLHDDRDSGLWYGFKGNETLQRAEGYRDDLGVLRLTAHKHRPQEVVRLGPIYTVLCT
jgi:hypothetical protein